MRALTTTALLVCAFATSAQACGIPDKTPVKQNPDSPIQIKGYFATMTANMLNVEFVNTATKTAKRSSGKCGSATVQPFFATAASLHRVKTSATVA